jgi:protein kinase C substrate 80K-H
MDPRLLVSLMTLISEHQRTDRLDVAAARDRHNTAREAFNTLSREISSTADTLSKMTDQFGPQAEWKRLDGTCVDKVAGE